MDKKLQNSLDRLNKVISQDKDTGQVGACCFGKKCIITTSTFCKGSLVTAVGKWHGVGSTCTANLCDPLGACCWNSTGECSNTTKSGCPTAFMRIWPKWHAGSCEDDPSPCNKISKLTAPADG